MATKLNLPIIDLTSPDPLSAADSIRQACTEYGFFYLVNHDVDTEFLRRVFDHSAKFFCLPLEHKLKLARKEYRGYTPLYAEILDPTLQSKGDPKETYYIGPVEDTNGVSLNQWPSQELLPDWRPIMESFYWKLFAAGKKLMSLIALSLNLDQDFFEKKGVVNKPSAFLRLLHYPGLEKDRRR